MNDLEKLVFDAGVLREREEIISMLESCVNISDDYYAPLGQADVGFLKGQIDGLQLALRNVEARRDLVG